MVLVFSPSPTAIYCLIKIAAYLLINTVCIFHDFLFIINLSYAAMKLYSGLVCVWVFFFSHNCLCNVWQTFPCLAKRGFARHFDAWFYLLYLHPIFTIEEFLDEKLIYGYLTICPLIIILIITIVCCVYVYILSTLSVFTFQILTLTILRFDIWVILLQDIGANEREWCRHVEFKVKGTEGTGSRTSRLPCVTGYSGVAVHVESPCIKVGVFWGAWYSFPRR